MPLKINPSTACFDLVTSPGSGTAVISIDVDSNTAPGTDPVVPTVGGQITISGDAVASHSVPIETHSRAANELNIEIQMSSAIASTDATKVGVCSFDSTAFTVNPDGYVQLAGGAGPAVDSIWVDQVTAPGVNPVTPDATGQIRSKGVTRNAHSNPVETHSRALNEVRVEIQLASAVAGAPAFAVDAGLCSFESTQFNVNAEGYVTLAGGTVAVDSNTGDDAVAVFPDAAGNFNWLGVTVANATHAKPVYLKDSATANAIDVDVQVAAAVAATPGDKNDAGLMSASSAEFTVSTHGFLELLSPVPQVPGAYNLGLFYSSPTFTIKGADGNNLSATNPGYVVIRSNVTSGKLITYKMTSNFTFDDAGGTSMFAGSLFGMTTGDTTTTERYIPFYLHAMADDTDANLSFFVVRYPNIGQTRSHTSTNISDGASGSADLERSTLALEVLGGSLADYFTSNATYIGFISLNMDGADDWTRRGENLLPISRYNAYMHAKGVMDQAANSYFLANGGTAPTDVTAGDNQFTYKIINDSLCEVLLYTVFAGGPTGAVNAIVNMPITGPNANSSTHRIYLTGTLVLSGIRHFVSLVQVGSLTQPETRQFFLYKNNATNALWQYEEFNNGDVLIVNDTYNIR